MTATDTDRHNMPAAPKAVFNSVAANFVALLLTWAVVLGSLALYAIQMAR